MRRGNRNDLQTAPGSDEPVGNSVAKEHLIKINQLITNSFFTGNPVDYLQSKQQLFKELVKIKSDNLTEVDFVGLVEEIENEEFFPKQNLPYLYFSRSEIGIFLGAKQPEQVRQDITKANSTNSEQLRSYLKQQSICLEFIKILRVLEEMPESARKYVFETAQVAANSASSCLAGCADYLSNFFTQQKTQNPDSVISPRGPSQSLILPEDRGITK
jgi:hypothetical protein